MPGPEIVFGYVGPGADLNLIGYAMTLIAFCATAVSAVVLWPVYTFLRWVRGGKKKPDPAAPPAANTPEEARADGPSVP